MRPLSRRRPFSVVPRAGRTPRSWSVYADKRDAETWNATMGEAADSLNVEVILTAADEATALIRHAADMDA